MNALFIFRSFLLVLVFMVICHENEAKRAKLRSAWRAWRTAGKRNVSRNVSGWEIEKRSPKPFNHEKNDLITEESTPIEDITELSAQHGMDKITLEQRSPSMYRKLRHKIIIRPLDCTSFKLFKVQTSLSNWKAPIQN